MDREEKMQDLDELLTLSNEDVLDPDKIEEKRNKREERRREKEARKEEKELIKEADLYLCTDEDYEKFINHIIT